MAQWILAAIALFGAIVGPYVGFRVGEAVNKRRWVEMDDIVKLFRGYHGNHFEHAKRADAEMARLDQRVGDHDERDEERFERIESMFKEIRDALRQRQ